MKRPLAAICVLAIAMAAPPAGHCQDIERARLLPVDEASRDPAFFAFRARLQQAVAARDTAAVIAVLDPQVCLSFGGDVGVQRFRDLWLGDREESLWVELGTVLALGGRFYGDTIFMAPYTFGAYRGDEPPGFDPFGSLFALGDAVPVYARPDEGASPIDELSFEMVDEEWRREEADTPEGWTALRMEDGTLGYVRSSFVRSPIDYRAIFARRDGEWRLTAFVAGD
ncbi:MAG: hypothetical protein PVF05_12180 [Gemmatimonadales bacterium]|jgi:hypothetical protein